MKVYLHPQAAVNLDEFVSRATVGLVPGSIVIIVGLAFNFTLFIFALLGLVVNLVSDFVYTLVDPRIDFESREV